MPRAEDVPHRRRPRTRLAALALALLPGLAQAANPAIAYETIPASACEPVSAEQRDMVDLVNGAWQFTVPSGTVQFICPVRSSFFHINAGQETVASRIFSLFMNYRDPDTSAGVEYEISAALYRQTATTVSSGTQVGPTLESSPIDDDDDQVVRDLDPPDGWHDMLDAQYHVRVTMSRAPGAVETMRFTAVGLTAQPPG